MPAVNRLDLRIEYVIAGKNAPRNLVYPFYLRAEEDDQGEAVSNGTNAADNG